MNPDLSRREFFFHGTLSVGSVWLGLHLARPRALRAAVETAHPAVFMESEWKTVEAITGRIIPADDQPGAVEAGCVNFIDNALVNEDAAMKPLYAAGLAGLEIVSRKRFEKSFIDLEPGQQDELIGAMESGQVEGWPEGTTRPERFFAIVREHTISGFLADPKYGGNEEYVGWKVSGYPGPRHHRSGYSNDQMVGKEKIPTIGELNPSLPLEKETDRDRSGR